MKSTFEALGKMNGSLQTEDKLKAMLKDLGKATLRGVQRCYKCGTVNGIRGTSCKNKACDVVFTEAGLKKKHSVVCKLHTDSSPQVTLFQLVQMLKPIMF